MREECEARMKDVNAAYKKLEKLDGGGHDSDDEDAVYDDDDDDDIFGFMAAMCALARPAQLRLPGSPLRQEARRQAAAPCAAMSCTPRAAWRTRLRLSVAVQARRAGLLSAAAHAR